MREAFSLFAFITYSTKWAKKQTSFFIKDKTYHSQSKHHSQANILKHNKFFMQICQHSHKKAWESRPKWSY